MALFAPHALAMDCGQRKETAMLEVRIHGRGGQGVVTTAEVLALAAFDEGRHAQAFPAVASEQTGAPVVASVRICDDPIHVHEPVSSPDVVVVADATLLHEVDVFAGLRPGGWVLVDSGGTPEALGLAELVVTRPGHCLTVPATELAAAHAGRPVPDVALLGALSALTGLVSLRSVRQAVEERFPGALATADVAAAVAAFHDVEAKLVPASSMAPV